MMFKNGGFADFDGFDFFLPEFIKTNRLEGEKKCEENAVWTCSAGADGCMQWEKTEACGDDKICNESFTCIFA